MDDPLAALRPLHTPSPIAWWPPAPGWWLLGLLLLVLIITVVWWRSRTALQRAALRELRSLEALHDKPIDQAAAINRLLKRYVRVRWPETGAAALTGTAWLRFLDEHGGQGAFGQGRGQVLVTLPYSKVAASANDLIDLARSWIKANPPGKRR